MFVGECKFGWIVMILGDICKIKNSVILVWWVDVLVYESMFNKYEVKMVKVYFYLIS